MKKLVVLASVAFLLSLIGCSNTNGNQEKTNIAVNSAGEAKVVPAAAEVEYLTYDTFLEKVWNFEKNPDKWVYEGKLPCVIDFYADWCKPCKMVAPIMDELAVTYSGKLKVYKINVDKEQKLASVFGVRSIPSVLFSPMEGKPMMQAGALPKEEYIRIINENVLAK
jgi:thioredoxin